MEIPDNRIKEIRIDTGHTLKQVAEYTGMSKSNIWTIENDKGKRPSWISIHLIAELFGVTPEYMMGYTEYNNLDDTFTRFYKGMSQKEKEIIWGIMKIIRGTIP